MNPPYAPEDWRSGKLPPEGWDVADAVDDGWTRDDVDAMLRASICDVLPNRVGRDKTGRLRLKAHIALSEAANGNPPAPTRRAAPQTMQKTQPARPPLPAVRAPLAAIEALPHVLEVGFDSEVFLANHLAHRLAAACGEVVFAEGQFWCWGPTAWSAIPHQVMRLSVHKFDLAASGRKNVKVGKTLINGVLSELGTILAQPDFFAEPAVGLNARNTVIEIDGAGRVTERAHSPSDRFRWTIPAEFHLHTDVVPPEGSMLHRLLAGSFRGDPDAAQKIDLIGEILASAAFGQATRLPQPKAFVFLGEKANNGKSTIAGLLRCLLPEGAVSAVPLSAFEDEKRVVGLAGKAANVADELSANAIGGEAFKSAVTGNVMQGRDVFQSVLTFVPQALHLFTTNVLPRFSGGLDRGLQRRLVVVGFDRSIPTDEVIPDILDRIRRDELDLLLGFAIAGMQRLMRNKSYTIPPSSVGALNTWLQLDPVQAWFSEEVVHLGDEPFDGWSRTSDLFKAFKMWAIDNGHSERFLPPVNTFSQRLRAMPGVRIKHLGRGNVAAGIGLRKSGDAPIAQVTHGDAP